MENPCLSALAAQIEGLDAEYAIGSIGGSEELYKKMLLQFRLLLPAYIREMDAAVHRDDWHAFAVKTHGLKGSLCQIGHFPLAKTGETLELAAKNGRSSYCRENYTPFKDELLSLFSKISAVLKIGNGTGTGCLPERKQNGELSAYADTLRSVRTALEDFDSLSAAELLSPLTQMQFDDRSDTLIAKAADALESFQPQKALQAVTELLFAAAFTEGDPP